MKLVVANKTRNCRSVLTKHQLDIEPRLRKMEDCEVHRAMYSNRYETVHTIMNERKQHTTIYERHKHEGMYISTRRK